VIVNLTQHQPTPEQVAAGVSPASAEVSALLNFTDIPGEGDISERARALAKLANRSRTTCGQMSAMIGGAPYLMASLERELRRLAITPLYSFTARESVEVVQPDGSVRKTAIFRHVGFVEAAQ